MRLGDVVRPSGLYHAALRARNAQRPFDLRQFATGSALKYKQTEGFNQFYVTAYPELLNRRHPKRWEKSGQFF
ncbi:unnamed protein product [Toxocara canis]|uniref:Transposase n=1 Tax=Toxocara canis TaxID=6265 RepID=A0A183UE42_TOXCA|nr:unnamed protein product [Toxocara canis]